MNTRIICRFADQAALDDFNKRNGTDITCLTKEYDVNAKTKIEKKPSKKKKAKKDDSERDAKWKDQWWQMPVYESHDAAKPYAQVDFKFNEGDLDLAKKIFDQNISAKTISVWYPKLVPGWYSKLRVVGGDKNPRYPIYIVSRSRSERCYTSRFLSQMEVPHFVVVEPQDVAAYQEKVANKYATILELDMSYKDKYDTLDDWDNATHSTGPGPARNFAWDDSIKRGYKWHWVMDDNATEGFHWFWHNVKVKCRTGALLAACEDWVDRYDNIAMFGPNYKMFVTMDAYHPPYTMNTRIYSCNMIRNDVPFRWRGRYNEDTILSLDMLTAGWCTVQANWALFGKCTTQKVKGGNTEVFYSKEGTKPKSEMLAKVYPDIAKVVWKFHRWHHYVDYSGFKQTLHLRDGVVPVPGENNYGMRVINTDEEDTYDTKSMLAEKYANAPDYIYGVDCPNTAETTKVEPTKVEPEKKIVVEAPKPVVANVESKPVVETAKPSKPKLELVVLESDMDNIDPRSLGKLMLALMDKVDLSIVHGDPNTDDIVVKLCSGLGVARVELCGPNNAPIYDKHVGKKVLKRCQPNEKPVFSILER